VVLQKEDGFGVDSPLIVVYIPETKPDSATFETTLLCNLQHMLLKKCRDFSPQ